MTRIPTGLDERLDPDAGSHVSPEVALPILYDDVLIASPCDEKWDDMIGDAQRRLCAGCNQNVYNLEAMHAEEIVDLIERTEGQFCRRVFLRSDGTVLTADCPVGLRRIARAAKRRLLLTAALAASAAAWIASYVFFGRPAAPEVVGPDKPIAKIIQKIEAATPPPIPVASPLPLGGPPPPPPTVGQHLAGKPLPPPHLGK